jgi:uncharacterized protein YjiS (DUF1127 family)
MLAHETERSMHGTYKPISSTPRVAAERPSRIIAWMAWLDRCLTCWRERRLLRELDGDQLKDIGLSWADVERECRRWPWNRAWD